MRILHVINHTGRFNGNVHAAVDLACAQAGLGHDVMVCHSGGDFEPEFQANGVLSEILRLDRSPVTLARATLALGGLMRRWRADVVHAHMVTSALLAAPGCRLTGRPLVATVHNVFDKSASLLRVADRVIAVSTSVKASMVGRGMAADRLRVVLNGTIGSARFSELVPRARVLESPSVLFVGGMHPRKGVTDLLDAFDEVHRRCARARLFLVGEGPMEMEYRARAAGLASSEAITFCGSQADPRPFFRGADICVLPSLAESAPLVLSEAREAGCAVIGTAIDGIPEMLEYGKAGILVPPRTPAKLARAIGMLVEDEAALAHWRACSQVEIDRLSVRRVASDTLAVYEQCGPAPRRATADAGPHQRPAWAAPGSVALRSGDTAEKRP